MFFFFFQAEDGIRDLIVTGVQTCALPIYILVRHAGRGCRRRSRSWSVAEARRWWRWEELNLRHGAYETPALPLSYTAGWPGRPRSERSVPHDADTQPAHVCAIKSWRRRAENPLL